MPDSYQSAQLQAVPPPPRAYMQPLSLSPRVPDADVLHHLALFMEAQNAWHC